MVRTLRALRLGWMVAAVVWVGGCDQQPSGKAAPTTQASAQPAAAVAPAAGLVEVAIKYPKALFIGTPKDAPKGLPMEPARKEGEPRPVLMAPPGTVNLALKRPVTGSDKAPTSGELSQITDGDKEAVTGSIVELATEIQWVQIDLGKPAPIWGIFVWHNHADPRVYKDVIVQVSDDADFVNGVTTIYNNDHDNSSGMGIGKDLMYFETNEGKLIHVDGKVTGRYVRMYSNGSTNDDQNHYTEIEVYGPKAK